MDVLIGAVIAAAAAAVGLAAGLAFRSSERDQRSVPSPEEPLVPPGVDEVLSVLRHSAVLLDRGLNVVKASPSAHAFGLVRQGTLTIPELRAMAEAVFRDGQIREVQLEISRSHATTRTIHVGARVAPLGQSLVLVLAEDRTPAIRADEVRRDFVANVSHELKTPIGALTLLAEAVQGAADDPIAVERFAQRMQEEGTRLTRLVQEIIDLSRLQYDDPVESPEVVEFDDVVAAALDRSRVDAETKQIQLASGGDAGVQVLGSESQLVAAVGNLVDNAIAYSPPHTQVAVGVHRRGDRVELSVSDQGIGIPEAEQDRIFERFYRVDPARSRATGGTGLGLSIVKHIAASHGGDVSVWSVPGVGSTFTLRLPIHTPWPGRPSVPSSTTSEATQ